MIMWDTALHRFQEDLDPPDDAHLAVERDRAADGPVYPSGSAADVRCEKSTVCVLLSG